MKHFLSTLTLVFGLLGLSQPWVQAQSNQTLVLANVQGFTNNTTYPPGNLQAIADGQAMWQPATQQPAVITNLNDGARDKVLRRTQTGTDNTDILTFPAVTSGTLTIAFDARASVAATRTLDVMLLPTSGGNMASLLGWGTITNKLCYYDGTNWIPVLSLDVNWHHIEMTNFLDGASFAHWSLKVDGVLLATNLPWRNTFTPGTAFSRLRIGGIRGTVGQFADMDNLVVTATVPVAAIENLILTNVTGDLGKLAFGFKTKTNLEYQVEANSSLSNAAWTPLSIVTGNGVEARVTNQARTNSSQFYRVKTLPPPGYADGYRGIWFTLGQPSAYGDKYSGGFATYTADHIPIAIYCAAVNKTFFVYGGTIKDQRHLLIMASYYDHTTGQVPRPTLVLDKNGVSDPHDNGSISIDAQGYIWVVVSGRATARPGWIFRSKEPYSVAAFDFIKQDEITYPQPHYIPGFGFFLLFTKYTNGRELYWQTSSNGVNWSAHRKLAGIGGHYQVSNERNGKICSFFNRHPGGNVDKRTDLYFVQTTNLGASWTSADGTPLTLPLTNIDNAAKVIDYASQGELVYTCDLNFDTNGNPVMLYVVSHNFQPGPAGDPRVWTITRWTGANWITSTVCTSDHNYDMGSLYIQPDRWLIIGPTQTGPQVWQAGGEMALWSSTDQGLTWTMVRQITTNSVYNHTYARRPLNAQDPFFVFWADGDPTQFTPSHLYFSNADGTHVHRLPYDMPDAFATPEEVLY